MPLNDLQKEILPLIANNRCLESYLAGGSLLNRSEDSPRFSRDLDIFHESLKAVEEAAKKDETCLVRHGFSVQWLLQKPGFHQAIVTSKQGDAIKMEWAQESNFRFFPLDQDPLFGFRLHDADLATNKILALAGRQTARDFLDALFLHQSYLSLGALIWAASGKDPGLTPEWILNEAKRENRFSQEALERAQAENDLVCPIDVIQTKQTWLRACQEAESLFRMLPPDEMGCLYLDKQGKPRTPDGNKIDLTLHYATVRGTLPTFSRVETSDSQNV